MRNKYHNRKTECHGIMFDSLKEAKRFEELLQLYYADAIRDLKLQPTFTLQEAFKTIEGDNIKAITYKADFCYREKHTDCAGEVFWKLVVEDVKGIKTEVYKIKRKMMLDKFGIVVKEV